VVNFDKVERTTQSVDPEQQAIVSEQKNEILPQAGQPGASSSNTATSYETTRSVETYSGAIGTVRKLTVAVLVADKVTITPTEDGAEPVPPAITPRTPEELARIETLVRNALGVDEARGDGVSVVSAPFDMPIMDAPVTDSIAEPTIVTQVMNNPKPVITIAALLVLLVVTVVMVKALRAPTPVALPPVAETPALSAAGPSGMTAALTSGESTGAAGSDEPEEDAIEAAKRPIKLPAPATTPEREQAIATVEQRPDAAVRVTRAWLRS
jgi:flagellar M-ring protein FliF